MSPGASAIEHVVVLMLENRSFDCMLGRLYPAGADFDGLTGSESNAWRRPDGEIETVRVWNDSSRSSEDARIPDPDPGESFRDMTEQIFGPDAKPGAPATMSGFVSNYMRQPSIAGKAPVAREVMHFFTPSQTPALSGLARAFAVSDRWYASAPCETWPNRFFLHCGTAGGLVNNRRSGFLPAWPRSMPTIFRKLGRHGRDWRIYFHDLPHTAMLIDLWPKIASHFCLFEEEFETHARENRLPAYSFIEPRYYPNPVTGKTPSDQHPPHNIIYGEQLIASIYNTLRNSPAWTRTLFVIIYDEHGGCYDHAPPPPAVSPGGPYPDEFKFDRYGVRVPAVIVSPYIPPGLILRPPPGGSPFDHCSIIATLERLFGLGSPMTPRVADAPDLLGALTLESPSNSGLDRIDVISHLPSAEEVEWHRRRGRNGLQRSLLNPLSVLPGGLASAAAHLRRFGSRRGW